MLCYLLAWSIRYTFIAQKSICIADWMMNTYLVQYLIFHFIVPWYLVGSRLVAVGVEYLHILGLIHTRVDSPVDCVDAEMGISLRVWPDWAIYCTLGNFLKPLAMFNLSESPAFLGNFCKGVKIYHFSREIIFGQLYRHLAIFFWSHWSLRKHNCPQQIPADHYV